MPSEFSNPAYIPVPANGTVFSLVRVASSYARLALSQSAALGRLICQSDDGTLWALSPDGVPSNAEDWALVFDASSVAPAPIIRNFFEGAPENGVPASLIISGTLTPDVASECAFVDDLTGDFHWSNGLDSVPGTAIVQKMFNQWWINPAYTDYNYCAYVNSDADTPVGLTDWTVVKGSGQPAFAAAEGGITGTPGVLRQLCIVGNNDVHICVRQFPVKWVKLNN
ncbi:MAG: hypothetical protein WCP45_05955 [Verrucomicrobiota bacterium]